MISQEESRAVSENCKWRIRKQFEQGELYGLKFLYGYKITKGQVKIEQKQAKVVRYIFSEYLQGKGCRQIASFLNGKKIPTLTGTKWSEDRIIKMIRNEKYAGNALLQKKYIADHLIKKKVKNRGELPMYYAEETHPAIIDLVTFERANSKMDENRMRNKGSMPAKTHPFSGMITCPNCGAKYTRKTTNGKAAWICGTYLRAGKDACPSKRIPEGVLLKLAASVTGGGDVRKSIKAIVPDGHGSLVFHLTSGKCEMREWENRSRKDSWTDEMKDIARRRSLKCNKQNGSH